MKKPREYNAKGMPLGEVPEFPLIQCRDCGRHDDDYMVKEAVWRAAFKVGDEEQRPRGKLCFDCLEGRLGRPLDISDFKPDVPCNRSVLLGYSMARYRIDHALKVLKACASNPNEMLMEVEDILENGP